MIHWLKSIKTECVRYRISGIAMITCLVISMLASQFGILIFQTFLLILIAISKVQPLFVSLYKYAK